MKYLQIVLILLISSSALAQLKISGKVLSEGPVEITYGHASDGNRYTVLPYRMKEPKNSGELEWQTSFKLPYWLEKNYSYALKFTDGTVEKLVIIHGPVPEGIWPKQKVFLDVDLKNLNNADETLVLYWSVIGDEYMARPLDEIDKINAESHRPLQMDIVEQMNKIVLTSNIN